MGNRVLFWFLVAAFVIGGIVVLVRVIGAGPAPGDPQGVLEEALQPTSYSFETQAIRRSTPYMPDDGSKPPVNEIHSLRAFAVDEARDRFVGRVVHVLPSTLAMSSDEDGTLARIGDGDWQQLPERIPASEMQPPMSQELLAANPRPAGDGWDVFSVGGKRAWAIDFDPTPQIMQSLLLSEPLGLSGPDQEAIAEKEYTPVWARALVVRDERAIVRVDVRIRLTSGVQYRIISNYTRLNTTRVTAPEGTRG